MSLVMRHWRESGACLAEETTFLDDIFLRQLMSVGEVDLVIAVPSYNNAETIAKTAQAIGESVQQNFFRDRVVILNVDGGSSDDTTAVFLNSDWRRDGNRRGLTSLRTIQRVSWQYAKTPSPGAALRTILAAVDLLRARSCAVISGANTTVTAEWVANLLRPAYREKLEYVAPLYARSKFQGLLARDLLYPMIRAIFGLRLRETYSDDWAFSGRLAAQCLEQDVWGQEAVRARPEAWMAVTAICWGYRCGQSFLGPKSPPPGAGMDTVEAIRQTVGSLFWCLELYQEHWRERTGSQPIPTFGPEQEILADGAPSNPEKTWELFSSGVAELEPVLSSILAEETLGRLRELARSEREHFRFESDLWVTALYEFAAAYHHAVINRDHVVQALVPLYRGRLYSFLLQHARSSVQEMQADAEALCVEFERQKPYLIERWKRKG
jgi:hypothetical protein